MGDSSFWASLAVWKIVGVPVNHSISQFRDDDLMMGRCTAILSHRMNIKNINPTKEITDPIEDIVFHLVNESG